MFEGPDLIMLLLVLSMFFHVLVSYCAFPIFIHIACHEDVDWYFETATCFLGWGMGAPLGIR